MGNKTSKLTDVQVNELEKITHLDGEEIKMWFANFIKESPNGVLDKSEFQNLFKIFFPFGESTRFSDYLFAVFDEDKNGVVDFKEFLLVFSKVSKGSFKEKAKL
jgi:Ca2+-binding EF-hand superfamily protein